VAWKTIELTEEEQKAGGGRPFRKFNAIGDDALGFYVKKETKTVNYKDGPKEEAIYIFYGQIADQHGVKSTREFEVTPPQDLRKKLEKAERPADGTPEGGAGLAPGMGHLVKMKFSSTKQIEGRDDPMKLFTVATDTEFKPQQPLPASVTWAKSNAPASKPAPEDDIPF
jgi:hypothetical protein